MARETESGAYAYMHTHRWAKKLSIIHDKRQQIDFFPPTKLTNHCWDPLTIEYSVNGPKVQKSRLKLAHGSSQYANSYIVWTFYHTHHLP